MSSSPPPNVPCLPDDLLVICLARVSRLYYPTLSLVSKRFRSLLTSLDLYETRTRLGCTESCLYLCLWLPGESNSLRWFTLNRRPVQITNPNPKLKPSCFAPHMSLKNCTSNISSKKEMKSGEPVLVSIPACKSPFVENEEMGVIAVGCNIYKISGYEHNGPPSSRVYVMDCRSHTWHEAPSMRVARKYPSLSVLDGKIYVVESFEEFDLSKFMECFDPKTGKWEDVQSPGSEICGNLVMRNVAMEGKLYLYGNKNMVYNPKENKWDAVGWMEYLNQYSRSFCVIDNVFYYHLGDKWSGMIKWYYSKGRSWIGLKGLEKLPTSNGRSFKLVNNGGKIAFSWQEDGCSNEKMIWCAEISLERRSTKEIYGNIEWCNVVLTVPKYSYFKQIISVTV